MILPETSHAQNGLWLTLISGAINMAEDPIEHLDTISHIKAELAIGRANPPRNLGPQFEAHWTDWLLDRYAAAVDRTTLDNLDR